MIKWLFKYAFSFRSFGGSILYQLDVFVDSPKLNKMFHEMEEWSTMLQCNTVAKLNRIIKEDHAGVIIQVAEAPRSTLFPYTTLFRSRHS